MEFLEKKTEYLITAHAKTRYAERIMGKESSDVNRFVSLNEDKIKTDINKMIEYGDLIYSGKSAQKDSKGNIIDVYLKNTWVILVDIRNNKVITLYKIDLGLDDDFNKVYVNKMLEKLNTSKATLEQVEQQVENENNTYKDLISEAELQLKDYRAMIKNLEELCASYKNIIENNVVKTSQANKEVADVLNQLIGKKEF